MILTTIIAACVASCAGDLSARLLAAHNVERAAVGVPPLAWDAALAAGSAAWARHLAATGRMFHSSADQSKDGENLFMGTRGGYSVEAMVGLWAAEKATLPLLASWEDDQHAVGHYTQMVWRTTTHVGCAVASGAEDDFLVCRYAPPGNVAGEQPFGVQALTVAVTTSRPPSR